MSRDSDDLGKSISGRVLTASGEPVEGADIQAYSNSESHTVRTRADGYFRVHGLMEEEYSFYAHHDRYPLATAFAIVVGTEDLDLVFPKWIEISGKVIAKAGTPIPRFQACVVRKHMVDSRYRHQHCLEEFADDEGRFTLRTEHYNDLHLVVCGTGYARAVVDLSDPNPENPIPPQRIVLSPGQIIQGRVRTPDGQPVAGAHVAPIGETVVVHELPHSASVVTDAAGEFQIADRPSKECRIAAVGPGYACGVASAAPGAPPPQIELLRAGTVEGKITVGDYEVNHAWVWATNASHPHGRYYSEVADDGSYRLLDLPVGDARLNVHASTAGGFYAALTVDVEVREGSATHAVIPFVSGDARLEGTAHFPQGRQLAVDLYVRVPSEHGPQRQIGSTNNEDRFSFEGLPSGPVQLVKVVVENGKRVKQTRDVVLEPGKTTTIDF